MKLILIRGLPGSGKSTLAKQLKDCVHLEADMYFMHGDQYIFDSTKLKEAHDWCWQGTRKFLLERKSVVVSNTFTQHWEMLRYKELAEQLNIPIEIIVAKGEYKSIHGVLEDKINQMRLRWQD